MMSQYNADYYDDNMFVTINDLVLLCLPYHIQCSSHL